MSTTRSWRWLFGDQLGPHFRDDADRVLLVESRAVLRRRRFHRQKAHLVLSALRHAAEELGHRARLVQCDTYREAVDTVRGTLTVCQPTSFAADRLVRDLPQVTVLPARGFCATAEDFDRWRLRQDGRMLLDSFYRDARRRLDVLMEGTSPVGGRWSLDRDNRQRPPRRTGLGLPEPPWPVEDHIDAGVRRDLDRWERSGEVSFVGEDGPRWAPVTTAEAERWAAHFLRHRLDTFGPYQDAMLAGDPLMSHSLLSVPLNLGLLDPLCLVEQAEHAYRAGRVELRSAEGFIRQLIGWRDYVWHLYWSLGPGYRRRNALHARRALPRWFAELDTAALDAHCLSDALRQVRRRGWTHHIPRLMLLGNWALQRGWRPSQVTDWFHRCFLDGYDWVMLPNVVGMATWADGGLITTKPYAAGGAYIDRMSDYCTDCRYQPSRRTGSTACPYTAGYWAFLDRHRERFGHHPRMARQARGLDRLDDLTEVLDQERARGQAPP